MKRILLALLISGSLAGAPLPALAQSPELMAAYRQIQELYAQGKYAEAEPFARKALELGAAEFGTDHTAYATLLNELAGLRRAQGRPSESESLYKRALAIYEKALGPDHPHVATVLYNMAVSYVSQSRASEAEPLRKRVLAIQEKALGPDHPEVVSALDSLAALYRAQGRFGETEPLYKRALAISEKALGPEHTNVANSLNNLAMLYVDQSRYAEAEPLYKRALAIWEKALGPDHSHVATVLNNLAALYRDQGRYSEAEPLHKRGLAIQEKTLGPDHPHVASSLNNLAVLYRAEGRTGEAVPLVKRALAIFEKALGPEDPLVATSLVTLAVLYQDQGRFDEAEPLHKRALAIKEKALGPDHPDVATSLNNLAELHRAQGRTSEAELLHGRALAIREKSLGPAHPEVGKSLANLAWQYQDQGRTSEAEPLYKRALAIFEKSLDPDHPVVATALGHLAGLYRDQGRTGEAEPLYKRALAIYEKALGPDHPSVALSLNNLAELYHDQGRTSEAELLYKRGLAIQEKALGPDHHHVAGSLNNLAGLYHDQGRTSEATLHLKRALAIRENALGPDHHYVATTLDNLAVLYRVQGRYREAEPLHKRALRIHETAFGPDHPGVAGTLDNLAVLYRVQGRHDIALEYIRRASAIHRGRATRMGGGQSAGGLSEQRKVRYLFLRHLSATFEAPADDTTARSALTAEGFEAGQLANATGAGAAVSRMAARFAAGDDALAGLVRARQDAAERWRKLDGALVKAASRPPEERDSAGEAAMRQELEALDERIEGIDTRLATAFPQFAELSSPQPVPLAEAQALLTKDEALLTYLVWDKRTFVLVVRRDRALARQIKLEAKELDEAVSALRRGLDPSYIRTLADIPPFDTTRAFELYRTIFQPIEPLLEGARHVFVVPDGALQSLPLGVLVTKESRDDFTDFERYRNVDWLARKYAMTTLPSVSSLRALRRFAKRAKAARPFLGIGDPKLKGETGSGRGVRLAALFTARGGADVDQVRQLASLPESAGELKTLARTLGAGDAALLLGTEATETRVKQTRLEDYKVLAFATHGLVAGDLTGLSEPALVLTPPARGSARDDGLLTASEVAQLKLDADWVILSACNTAAADGTPGAEGLSGLAKAFFYAGSRALLVSHWPVASEAAVGITTRMLTEARKPGVGRAEAHRRAMLALIEDKDRPHFAHPLFWAPFVVVGEGGSTDP